MFGWRIRATAMVVCRPGFNGLANKAAICDIIHIFYAFIIDLKLSWCKAAFHLLRIDQKSL